ncbi:MAG: ribbon-helix-helix domain-containing protein [Nocardioides sp.]|nr:ribbon-helix-helix domain-containing protein [Nocardioides sp.]
MATTQPSGHAPARKVIVTVTIVSFSVAALLGVLALLGGDFGDTQVRVLLTTLTVGVVSIAVLCYLSTAGTPFQLVGVLGGASVLVPLTTALLMIWGSDPGGRYDDAVWQAFGVGTIVAGTLAQGCLLLVIAQRRSHLVRLLLVLTLVLAGVLAAILSAIVLGALPDEEYVARGFGVVAILDVLGTVVVAALAKFGPGPGDVEKVSLPAEMVAELDRRAAASGRSRDDFAAAAIDHYLRHDPS